MPSDCIGSASPVVVESSLCAFNNHAGATPGWPTDVKSITPENGYLLAEDSEIRCMQPKLFTVTRWDQLFMAHQVDLKRRVALL